MHKAAIAGLGSALLVACSGGAGTMNGIMQSWQGAPIDSVIGQWGYPHEQREIAGRTIYIWYRNTTLTMPMTSNTTVNVVGNTAYATTHSYGGSTSQWSCTRMLEVNKSNIVVSWQWEGNNCPFAEAFQYAHWRNRSPSATGGTVQTVSVPIASIDTSTFRDVTPYSARVLFNCQLWGAPGFSGEALAELSADSIIEVEREADNWLYVRLKDGKRGYIGRSWIE